MSAGRDAGLLVDFGGVLTSDVFVAFREFCSGEGLDPDAFVQLMATDPEALAALRRVECGEIDEDEFGRAVGALLGVERTDGLVDRLLGGLRPDEAMIDAVRRARAAGVRTALVSNSIGRGRYDRALAAELFDALVISAAERVRKPEPAIYRLAAERVGLAPERCVFVDDLPHNCEGAEAVGMTALLHRDAGTTIPELERLLGVELR